MIVFVILPASLVARDEGVGILRSYRDVRVNGTSPRSTAPVFPGDVIEARSQSPAARIELVGSSVEIDPETVVQFGSGGLRLDHGSMVVNTFRAFRVRVGCLTVTPMNADWTQYRVSDLNGRVDVAAVKGDVNIDSQSDKTSAGKSRESREINIHEGEQKSRTESCDGPNSKTEVTAKGPRLDSPYSQWPASGLIGGITCWALCRGDDPISPASPSKKTHP